MHLLGIVSIIYVLYKIISESLEKPKPLTYFDWDAYYEDIRNGMSCTEQLKKRQKGGYDTTNPKYAYDALNDVERYERDKKQFGVETAEKWKKQGHYRLIKIGNATYYSYPEGYNKQDENKK